MKPGQPHAVVAIGALRYSRGKNKNVDKDSLQDASVIFEHVPTVLKEHLIHKPNGGTIRDESNVAVLVFPLGGLGNRES